MKKDFGTLPMAAKRPGYYLVSWDPTGNCTGVKQISVHTLNGKNFRLEKARSHLKILKRGSLKLPFFNSRLKEQVPLNE